MHVNYFLRSFSHFSMNNAAKVVGEPGKMANLLMCHTLITA